MNYKKRQRILKRRKAILAAQPVSLNDFHQRVIAKAAKQGKGYCSVRIERNVDGYGNTTQIYEAYIEGGKWWNAPTIEELFKKIDDYYDPNSKPPINEVLVDPFEQSLLQ